MKNRSLLLFLLVIAISSCKQEKESPYSLEEINAETAKANSFFDEVYSQYIDRHPMDQSYLGIKKDQDKWNIIADTNDANEIEIVKKNLARLKSEINYDKLDEQAKLSYRLYEYNAKEQIDGFKWRYYNYPINQLFGLHSEVPSFLINIHLIKDTSDAEAYIARVSKVDGLFDELISNMETRVKLGIIPPKFVFGKVLDDCKSVIEGFPFDKSKTNNALYSDFKNKVEHLPITHEEKNKLIRKAERVMVTNFLPAYQKLIIYITNLEKLASEEDGVWRLPQGTKFYEYAIQHSTTTKMKPEEVFQLGVDEVKRIHEEMRKIMKKVNYTGGELRDFFNYMRNKKEFYYLNDSLGKKAYLERSEEIIKTIKGRLEELFITKPKANLIVKAVEPFREKSTAGAFYQEPAPNGSRPGTYYANLYDMNAMPKYEMEALCYHEAIPGHHMQIALAQELKDIPKFRKFGMYTAYTEGWGLYSEYLPKELGSPFYSDPYSDFGRLSKELLRACRLVVDVGIHYKKWTREDAVKYLLTNTPNAETDSRREIDRYIVWPGQATAYKIGMYKILKLRYRAKKELGKAFNIREFHEVVLKNGALPLDVLEEKIMEYISEGKNYNPHF